MLPGEAPLFRLAEGAGLPDPVGDFRKQGLVGVHGRSSQQAGVERGIGGDPLEGFGEGVDQLGRELGDVVEGSESAAGPEHLGRLGRAGDGVHPVPGGACDDRVELPPGRLPVLEPGDLDLDTAPSRKGSHPLVGLDTEHRAAGRLELPGLDAGPGSDVEDVPTGACRDDPVHQGLGIRRSGAVVAFGVHAERLGRLPMAVGLGSGLVRLSLR